MLKDTIKKYMKVKYQRVSLVQHLILILVAVSGLVLVYAATVQDGLAKAGNYSSLFRSSGDEKAAAKQAVLNWMGENSAMPDHILMKIYNAAAMTGNRDLILAICLVESNFNPHVESHRGAIGLMGIMPEVWLEELMTQGIIREKEDLYKISGNIAAGAYVLGTYLSETNDLRQALNRYVGGASWYVTKVLQTQRKIEQTWRTGQQLAIAVVHD